MKKLSTQEKVLRIQKKIDALEEELGEIQASCPHKNCTTKNCCNTGNYDPSADSYWKECKCLDCDKWWTESQ